MLNSPTIPQNISLSYSLIYNYIRIILLTFPQYLYRLYFELG